MSRRPAIRIAIRPAIAIAIRPAIAIAIRPAIATAIRIAIRPAIPTAIRLPGRPAIRPAVRTIGLVFLASLVTAATATGIAAGASQPRASLTDIENDVMCVACRESLAVAQSPQAESERNYIRSLIAQGETKQQIEQNLVAQYGPAVLGRPPAHGFNLTVYVLPPAILAAGIAILAIALPRWRRRSRAAGRPPDQAVPALDPAEAKRLEQELSQFRG